MPHLETINIGDTAFTCVSFLDTLEVPAEGPPLASLVTRVPAGIELSPETAETNPAFLAFLHDALAEAGPSEPTLKAAAEKQKTGWLYVLDMRTPPNTDVTKEEVIGIFRVDDGVIAPGSYRAYDSWKPVGAQGMFKFPSWLRQLLRKRLFAGSVPGTSVGPT